MIEETWQLFSNFLTNSGYAFKNPPELEKVKTEQEDISEQDRLVQLLHELVKELQILLSNVGETTSNPVDMVGQKYQKKTNLPNVCSSRSQSPSISNVRIKEEKGLKQVRKKPINMDPDLVQIRAARSEIERRITAFIERKQDEVNETNRREFCNVIKPDPDGSCARTDAMFVARVESKSHVKVSRVVNKYGPQLQVPEGKPVLKRPHLSLLQDTDDSSTPSSRSEGDTKTDMDNLAGVEERLHNLETHSKLMKGGAVPGDVFSRLKALENRMLYLEGISPEYFNDMPPCKGVGRSGSIHQKQNLIPSSSSQGRQSLGDIEARMTLLKQSLLQKQQKQSNDTGETKT